MNFSKHIIIFSFVATSTVSMNVMATNGYFSHGYGMKAKGMAGAGIAYGQGALAGASNPANMVFVGDRIDFGIDLFIPDRKAEITSPNPTATNYDPNEDFAFFIPEFGYNRMINDAMSLSIFAFGNGGMNTSYEKPIALLGSTNAGVNLEQLFISPTFSIKANDKHAFGVSLNFVYQRFEATGLQNFAPLSNSPDKLTDNGVDTATGFSLRVGWVGQISERVTLGATYQSKADMSEFDDYKGLFAEQGDFDVPKTYGIGIAVKASDDINLVFDITEIKLSEIASVNNPLLPALGGCAGGNSSNCLGGDNGMGFGWQDITAYKLGADYKLSNTLTLRAGFNYSDQPIPAAETLFNLLAPAVERSHVTAGATWTLSNQSELSFALMYAFEKTIYGNTSIPQPFGGGEANLSMREYSLGVSYGWSF